MKSHFRWALSLSTLIAGLVSYNPVQAATRSYTFAVPDSLHIPPTVLKEIRLHTEIPASLPRSIALNHPLPSKWQLAISLDVSSRHYGMDIFERLKSSHTNRFPMAGLVGDIESVSNLKSFGIPYDFNVRRFTAHKAVQLSGNVTAINYRNPRMYENAILWKFKRWKFIAEGLGSAYENETFTMANSVSKLVQHHGLPVSKATHGYVQVIWAGNRPLYRVTWTFNDTQWYSLSMATLTETLRTANTVTGS